jgi:predicted nucleic acid-binding protein
MVLRGLLTSARAAGAVGDLADAPVSLFPSMALRARARELRENLAIGDALFVALAERPAEPLATRDLRLVAAVGRIVGLGVQVSGIP